MVIGNGRTVWLQHRKVQPAAETQRIPLLSYLKIRTTREEKAYEDAVACTDLVSGRQVGVKVVFPVERGAEVQSAVQSEGSLNP